MYIHDLYIYISKYMLTSSHPVGANSTLSPASVTAPIHIYTYVYIDGSYTKGTRAHTHRECIYKYIHTYECMLTWSHPAVVGCKIPRKENSPIFRLFSRSPLPVSPGKPEVNPKMDQNRRSG